MPACKQSVHKHWQASDERSFDIVTLVYDKEFIDHQDYADFSFQRSGSKSQLLDWFFSEHEEVWGGYNSFWLTDDDLLCSAKEVNRLFDIFEQNEMSVAQPSLTKDSPHSYKITLNKVFFQYRKVNFIEVMCPMFSRSALVKVIPLYRLSESAWGLDELWSQQVFADTNKYIIDAVQVKHLRPIRAPKPDDSSEAGGLYAVLEKNPHTELQELSERYQFKLGQRKKNISSRLWGGINANEKLTEILVRVDKIIFRLARKLNLV